MLFVARPFLGFAFFNQQYRPKQVHSILVKSFSKRKPESLEEANANVEFIHHLLTNPLAFIISTISFLLLTLFPSVFKNCAEITNSFLSDMLVW
jgi:hypothetical protein